MIKLDHTQLYIQCAVIGAASGALTAYLLIHLLVFARCIN